MYKVLGFVINSEQFYARLSYAWGAVDLILPYPPQGNYEYQVVTRGHIVDKHGFGYVDNYRTTLPTGMRRAKQWEFDEFAEGNRLHDKYDTNAHVWTAHIQHTTRKNSNLGHR